MRRSPALLAACLAAPLQAQSLDSEAIALIVDTADRICGNIAREGGGSSASLEGEVGAEVSGLLGKLVDLGVSGTGGIESDEYYNVLREELGPEIRDTRRCREKIWDDMNAKLGPAATRRPETRPAGNSSLTGDWTYVAICPAPSGFGQITVTGQIEMQPAGGNRYQGTVRSDLGDYGQVVSSVSNGAVMSQVFWADATTTTASGNLSPDGMRWIVQDSDGCRSELTRSAWAG